MIDIEQVSTRLRTEVMEEYGAVRVANPAFSEAVRMTNFFVGVYAKRGNMDQVTVPVKLMQHIWVLTRDAIETAASGSLAPQNMAPADNLNKVWYQFAGSLVEWVQGQGQKGPIPDELWYSCYRVPAWLIEAIQQDAKDRERL